MQLKLQGATSLGYTLVQSPDSFFAADSSLATEADALDTRPCEEVSAGSALSARSIRGSDDHHGRSRRATQQHDLSAAVLDTAVAIHRAVEPGLLESVCVVTLPHVLHDASSHGGCQRRGSCGS